MDEGIFYTLYSISGWVCFSGTILLSYYLGQYHRSLLKNSTNSNRLNAGVDIEKEKEKFWALFQNEELEKIANSNIHPDLYCYETFMKLQTEPHPEEEKWKARKLIEYTPQGNIVMFYDLYKQAFAYYSDMQISHKWLNACAMKYVRTFCCRDFFWDLGSNAEFFHKNPFLGFFKREKEEEKKKIQEKKDSMKVDFNADVFIKKNKQEMKNEKDEKNNIDIPSSTMGSNTNHFRYLGKWRDFQINHYDPNHVSQNSVYNKKQQLSYADFKKIKPTT